MPVSLLRNEDRRKWSAGKNGSGRAVITDGEVYGYYVSGDILLVLAVLGAVSCHDKLRASSNMDLRTRFNSMHVQPRLPHAPFTG
jgi:hypothetical protein